MLKNYLKIAWRSLKRNKTYAGINVLGLVLSMASSLLIFAFIHFHLNFDDFHTDEDRIYRIGTKQQRETTSYIYSVPPALGAVLRRDYDFEESLARVVNEEEVQVTYRDNQKVVETYGVSFVEPAFFEIFNFPLKEGEVQKEFLQPGKAAITERMARKYFGDQAAIGQSLKISNAIDLTISAVLKDLPQNTFQQPEIFISYPSLESRMDFFVDPDAWNGISSQLQCFVKLKNGVKAEDVEQAMAPFPEKYRPGHTNVHTYMMQPLYTLHSSETFQGPMPNRTLWTLGIIGAFLIISSCLNFINLATAQVFNRLKEVGVRKSLGSMKNQLFGQFLTETSLIALVAVIFSFVVALLFLPYLNELFAMELTSQAVLNGEVVGFAALLTIFITLLSGSYPGLLLARFSPIMALKGKLSGVQFGGINLRKALIVVQFVISQVLIIGMLVIIKQINYSQHSQLGFDREAVVMIRKGNANQRSDVSSFMQQLSQKSNILGVTECFAAPSSVNGWGTGVRYKGKDENESFHVTIKSGDEAYVNTFGLELLAGRNIRKSDSLNEILVNETFTKKMNFASPEEAIGQYFNVSDRGFVPVVGVLKDFHTSSMYDEIQPAVVGFFDNVMYNYAVKLNPKNIRGGLAEVEQSWSSLNPEEVFIYEFIDDIIREFYESDQRLLSLIKIFTGIAIFIGCMGLFGLISFMVERKTKEIGVRKVLGGSVASILWLFGREFLWLIAISFVVAAPVAWYFSDKWLQDFAFSIPLGANLFLTALLFTVLAATFSVMFKVLKAAAVNPVKSLRSE